jgi:serine/threonine protein phosphatase 1
VTGDSEKFAKLGRPRRIWAIAAVHGAVDRLMALHDHVAAQFQPGDRLVYLGNLIGHSDRVHALVDEVLSVRRSLIARPGVLAEDVIFLRGAQEEMWQKMLQLQFAPNPQDVLRWMLAQGVEPTLRAYGGRAEEGLAAAREGAIRLTRWTNALRESIRSAPGHNALYAALRRAAFTERAGTERTDTDGGAEGGAQVGGGALFVSAGIDPSRPLAAQGDAFWWSSGSFAAITAPFDGFHRLVRGYDPAGGGLQLEGMAVTLDSGCGRGGRLAAGLFEPDGSMIEIVEV